MRDFLMIMEQHKYFDAKRWNKSDSTYTFETGSKLEFFSADQPGKVRGPRRDRLFGNEVNNWANGLESFEQLEVRTKDEIWMDWNPTNEFWYYDKIAKRTDCEHIILTYKDNEGLSQTIIDSIEQRKNRKGWWLVYGLGQLGEVEGKIYKNWEIIDEIPKGARLERYGLDFGYSNDPTSIVAIYYHDGRFILDEVCFLKGMSNKRIADLILDQETTAMVVADSAEPKSIDEIKSYGVNIVGAVKKREKTGPARTYVEWKIQLVQDQNIAVTKRSTNIIKEYRNYLWKVDKDGNVMLNPSVPEHEFSHSMNAIEYGIVSIKGKVKPTLMKASEPALPLYESWN
jgi:phage terminase large subunit